MRERYLIRLYRHSRMGFIVVILFMLTYAWFLRKKMDMMYFPFNAMFAYERTGQDTILVYRLKLNDNPLNYTQFPYWKKDFLETSLRVYAHYLQAGRQVYAGQYILDKWGRKGWGDLMMKNLTPLDLDDQKQLAWYATFAGARLKTGDQVSLQYYRLIPDNIKGLVVADSGVVIKMPLQ